MKRTSGTINRFSPDWINSIPRWLARGIWDAIEEGIEGGEHAGTKEKSRRLRNIQLGNLNECNRGRVNMAVNAMDEHNRRRDERIAKTAELQRDHAKRISERLTDIRRHEPTDGASVASEPSISVERGDGGAPSAGEGEQ